MKEEASTELLDISITALTMRRRQRIHHLDSVSSSSMKVEPAAIRFVAMSHDAYGRVCAIYLHAFLACAVDNNPSVQYETHLLSVLTKYLFLQYRLPYRMPGH